MTHRGPSTVPFGGGVSKSSPRVGLAAWVNGLLDGRGYRSSHCARVRQRAHPHRYKGVRVSTWISRRLRRTTRDTCSSSRVWRPSASGLGCTSGPPTPGGSCSASGRSSTTASTRLWRACCRSIEVILYADGSAEVHDDGRGIPVDAEPKTGLSGVEVVFTRLHAGGKFGGGSYVATGGLHGVGASVVNALSPRLDVEVDRSPGDLGDVVPARRRRRHSPRRRARRRVSAGLRADQGRPGQEGRQRAPDPVLARPSDLHQGCRVRVRRAGHPGASDVVHRARTGDLHP